VVSRCRSTFTTESQRQARSHRDDGKFRRPHNRLAFRPYPTVLDFGFPVSSVASSITNPAVLKDFWRSYLYWLPPALLGLALTLFYLNPFIGDWDALDYTIASLNGEPSPMALGRSLFTLFNFALYTFAHKVFGVGPENAYLLFKFAVVAQVPLAIVMCWILARDLTRSLLAATLAGLMIAISPVIVLYGSQVMTEVPSLWLLAAALIVHLRGLRSRRVGLVVAGAALLGLAVNLRETNAFYFPWLVSAPFLVGWKLDRRTIGTVASSLFAFILFAVGPFALWFALSAGYRAQWHVWFESGRSEAARHPLALSNLKPFFAYFFLVSPVVFVSLPFAFVNEWRRRGLTILLLAAGVGLFANAILILNYSTVINWRYFVTGLPAMAPLAANYLLSLGTLKLKSPRRAVATITTLILVVALRWAFCCARAFTIIASGSSSQRITSSNCACCRMTPW